MSRRVENDEDPAVDESAPALTHSIVLAVAMTGAVLFVGSFATVWAMTGKPIDGVGVGLFTAFWGGPGFGIMFGPGFHTLRLEREQRLVRARHVAAHPVAPPTAPPDPVGNAPAVSDGPISCVAGPATADVRHQRKVPAAR